MFLIYNTVMFSVVQRRAVIGTLRLLGATGSQVFSLVLLETAAASAVGTLLGLGLGWLLGQGAVRLVTQTINDLYYVLSVSGAPLTPFTVAKAVALGLGAGVLAAVAPALEAARVEPVEALRRSAFESRARRLVPRVGAAGAVLAVLGGLLLAASGRSLVASFAGLFGIVLGLALLAPLATVAAMALVTPLAGRVAGTLGRLATRTVTRSVSRTGVAVAALAVAVSVSIGVGLMIESFRSTVENWLDLTLRADVFVAAPAAGGARVFPTISPDVAPKLAAVPGVAWVETFRSVRVASPLGEVNLGVADPRRARDARLYRSAEGDPARAWEAAKAGAVIVTEPFAFRHRLPARGATRHARSPTAGLHTFPVAGVFYDYATEQGTVFMTRNVYERYWDDRGITSVGAHLAPGASVEEVTHAARAALAGTALSVTPNRSLRAHALRDLRPHLRGHPVAPPPGRGRGLHRRVERAHGAAGGEDARAGDARDPRPRRGAAVGARLPGDGAHGRGGRPPRPPPGLAPRGHPRPRHQRAVLRLDDAPRRRPVALRPGVPLRRRRRDPGLGLPAAAPAAAVAGRGAEAGMTVIPSDSRLPGREGSAGTRALAAVSPSSPSPLAPCRRSRSALPARRSAAPDRRHASSSAPDPGLEGFARATAPRPFALPADHGPHLEYQTEWWYYTGNLAAADGRRFGFQLTFFRRGFSPGPPPGGPGLSANQVYFAHFAITDVAGAPPRRGRALLARRGRAGRRDRRAVRGVARGLAGGFAGTPTGAPFGSPRATRVSGLSLDLELAATKPLVAHGDRGLSPKSDEPGNASYYVGYTRMTARGRIGAGGDEAEVAGEAWFDHEWSTSALGAGAVGWDWFSLQLDDGRELMLFQIRREDGSIEPASGGTLVERDGRTRRLAREDVSIDVLDHWTSPETGARYPSRWRAARSPPRASTSSSSPGSRTRRCGRRSSTGRARSGSGDGRPAGPSRPGLRRADRLRPLACRASSSPWARGREVRCHSTH